MKIEDPGDGSLLTVTTNDTLTTVYDRPSFHALRLAPGTTLDIFGNSIAVGDLEGLGMITNSNAYYNYPLTVTNSWKVSAADVAAGGVLRVHVPFAFAAGTTFAAENLANFPHSEEPIVLCVADAPIEGMPVFDRLATNATRKWKLVKLDGGKSIDTSMGFTPLAGVLMGTRSSEVDPALLPFIAQTEKLAADGSCLRDAPLEGLLFVVGCLTDDGEVLHASPERTSAVAVGQMRWRVYVADLHFEGCPAESCHMNIEGDVQQTCLAIVTRHEEQGITLATEVLLEEPFMNTLNVSMYAIHVVGWFVDVNVRSEERVGEVCLRLLDIGNGGKEQE